ncbi:hypothetical protein [Rhabdothermincola salaria]|uniref:hypothetical protein n=1 Tax=Rhabdothermincola salaria TaxID=2903142 RepID=UPI001E64EEA2|nr:hypothetical protein [Rhabdothermincola salaria]MCD9624954.1 hypothetical protein [Rhabdothermincola salaria]
MALALVAAGCGDDSGAARTDANESSASTERSDPAADGVFVPYALLEAPGWTLREAIDLPPDHILTGIEPVPSEWYAEYQRLEPAADGWGHAVKLAGFAVGLDAYRSSMEELGVSFEPVDTAAGEGLAGTTAEQGARPVIVVVPLSQGTLELLSYELSSEELVALVGDIDVVDDAGWRAAGGQVT